MRPARFATIALLLVVVTGSLASAARPQPSVRVLGLRPLKLAGAHFHPREHLKVQVTLGGKQATRRVTATAAGSFVVTFQTTEATDPCSEPAIRIVRANGKVKVVRIPPRMCAPATTP